MIGCPPFSGFFSKDAILALAYERSMLIFALALFTALLTAFYMTRLFVVVFLGQNRRAEAKPSSEAPVVMTGPLIVLAIFSALAGFTFFANRFLVRPHETEAGAIVPILAVAALLTGTGIALALYRNRESEPFDISVLRRRFYIDEFYDWLIDSTQETLARFLAFIDRWILDAGIVGGASRGTWGIGAGLRLFQTGNLQAYAFLFGLGIVVLIYFTVFR